MTVRLDDTTAGEVSRAIDEARYRQGAGAVSRVLTLVIVADEASAADAMDAASDAAREHPCRILTAIPRPGRGPARLDAAIQVGGGDGLGELVELRLRGPLSHHVASVVLPLLVPDAPVVVWWPGACPEVPAEDPVGMLAQRRITDAAAVSRPLHALELRRQGYRDGDTDLAWTRLTPWRALLAATLDQPHDPITGATVHVQRSNPSGTLLASWLNLRLGVPVQIVSSRGPGVTQVAVHTTRGDLAISRPSGGVAVLSRPGFPDREAALHRRTADHLIAEELRRLDADEPYGETLAHIPALAATPSAGKEKASRKAVAAAPARARRGTARRSS